MGGPLFITGRRQSQALSRAQIKAMATHSNVVGAITRITREKREKRIVPDRPTWIELKRVLSPEEMTHLDLLVEVGAVNRWDSINYFSYEINLGELTRYERSRFKSY